MKKVLSILLILALVTSLSACGSGTKDEPLDTSTQGTSDYVSSETQSNDNQEKTDLAYGQTFKLPGKNIFIDYRDDKRESSGGGYSTAFYKDENSLSAFSYDVISEYSGDLDDVIKHLSKNLCSEVSVYCKGSIASSDLVITESSSVTIAGYQAIKFVGTINNGVIDCFTYGYSFVINDVPCMVVGIVSEENQQQNLIDEISKEVDTMASTLRTSR